MFLSIMFENFFLSNTVLNIYKGEYPPCLIITDIQKQRMLFLVVFVSVC